MPAGDPKQQSNAIRRSEPSDIDQSRAMLVLARMHSAALIDGAQGSSAAPMLKMRGIFSVGSEPFYLGP